MTKQEFIESIRLEGEEWRPIDGYYNLYYVSTFGRVLSIRSQKLLKIVIQKSRNKPYACVCLSINGNHKKVRVHRLVAQTFISNPNGYKEIDHIDNDGTNNNISNLIWCSRLGNINNPKTLENLRLRSRKQHGENDDIEDRYMAQKENGKIINIYTSNRELKIDGFNPNAVYLACKGIWKQYMGFEWSYINKSTLISMSKNS